MNIGRNAAVTAAIACALSAPLVIAPYAAKADELTDLRANNQLLQQRLDQLAQIPSAGGGYTGGVPGAGVYPPLGGGPAAGKPSLAGSFPRSFLIPGTDTSIRVGGVITEIADYYFNGGNASQGTVWNTTVGDNGQIPAAPLTINRPGSAIAGAAFARSTSIFGQSPRESKMNVETRTPTAWGEARTFMEFDWAGSTAFIPGGGNPTSVSDNLAPRLRFAYATLGGFLAGQANSNFSDPDANGETLDFGGNVGEPGVVRIPQVRYTMPLAPWGVAGALSVSAEQPETDVWTFGGILGQDATLASPSGSLAAGTVDPTKSPAPDLTAAWYIPQPWGHMDFGTVLRPALEVKDGAFVNRTYSGWGVHFGGDVKPGWFGWAKDDIIFHFTYGDALGRYLNGSTNFALVTNYPVATPATAAAGANVLIDPTVEWGGEVGYQHWWLPNLHSNISVGINHHDINTMARSGTPVCAFSLTAGSAAQLGTGGCGLNTEIVSTHANLIWNPVPFVTVGLEYVYGHRIVVSNLKGDVNALVSKFAVAF